MHVSTLLLVFSAVAVGSCRAAEPTADGDPDRVSEVVVVPASISVTVGDTARLTATPGTSTGAPVPGCPIAWSSSAPAVAQVDAEGLTTALALGNATVTAECEGVRGEAAVSVVAVAVSADTLFVDSFESGALGDAGRWQDIFGDGWSIVDASAEGISPRTGTRVLKVEPTGGAITHFVATGATSPYENLRFSYWMYRGAGYESGGLRAGSIKGSKDQWGSFGNAGSCPDEPTHPAMQEYFAVALTQPSNIGWRLRMYNYWRGMQKQQISPPVCYGTYAMGPDDTPQGTYLDPDFVPAEERWYHYEIELQLNTPAVADGWEKVWVDGVLKIEHTGVQYRNDPLTRVWVVRFDVGSTTVGVAYFDDIVVTTR